MLVCVVVTSGVAECHQWDRSRGEADMTRARAIGTFDPTTSLRHRRLAHCERFKPMCTRACSEFCSTQRSPTCDEMTNKSFVARVNAI